MTQAGFGLAIPDGSGIALEECLGRYSNSGNIIESQYWPVRGCGIRVDYAGAPLFANNISRITRRRAKAADLHG